MNLKFFLIIFILGITNKVYANQKNFVIATIDRSPITYFDLKQKVTLQKTKLDEISTKFKEIKTLAIKYKDDKDIEIQKLKEELEIFKKTIEESNILYESLLDKTTQSLEKIISNTESLSKIQ